jgi:serine/threonine-protein kinase
MTEGRLGKYELLGTLGRGGMGEVLLARQRGPGGFSKTVVIKRLLSHLGADRTRVAQFLNEARLAALISHPNVIQVFDFGEDRDGHYLVMEHVRGHSVRTLLRALQPSNDRVPVGLAVWIVIQALRGLHAAHTLTHEGAALRIIHRDVTPENVLIGLDGSVKVADFGIARATDTNTLTEPGVVKGKLAYLSPDQLQGGPADARTDVYSAAVVLYELLAGRPPFAGATEGALVYAILNGAPTPLPSLRPEVSAALDAEVQRALRTSPGDRPSSALELAHALGQAAVAELAGATPEALAKFVAPHFAGLPEVGAAPEPAASRAKESKTHTLWRRSSRPRLIAAAAALAAALAGIALGLGAPRARPPEEPQAGPAPARPDAPMAVTKPAPPSESPPASTAPARPPPAPRRTARTGRVQLWVKPWAEIFWRGRSLGLTPLTQPLELPAGPQTLTLRNRELNVTRELKVVVRPGVVAELRADLLNP